MCRTHFIFLFLLLTIPANSFSWSAKVVSVVDGDTINVLQNGLQKNLSENCRQIEVNQARRIVNRVSSDTNWRQTETAIVESLSSMIKKSLAPGSQSFANQSTVPMRRHKLKWL